MLPLSRVSFAGVLAIAAVAAPASADIIFTDGTFNLGNYTASPTVTSGGASLVYTQCASCGTPGNGLELTATFPNSGPFAAAVGLANTTFAFDPSIQGPISSIDLSVDKNIFVDFAFANLGNNLRAAILQDGVFYVAFVPGPPFNGPGGPGYINFASTGLTETSFQAFDFATGALGAATPDFEGNPMLFGLVQFSSVTAAIPAPATVVTQYDNLTFTIHGVPEPGTIALFGAALFGMGWLRRRATFNA